MATMYVYNIPTNETVNLRATPNGTILVRVPYGAAVEASPSATSDWHNASVSNMWRNVAPITDTTMIQFSTTLTGTERQTLSTALQSDDVDERIKTIEFVYSEKNGRYILQRDVELQNGRHILIDSKTSFISS